MKRTALDPADTFVRFSRRSLWLALVLIVLLGSVAVLLNLAPDSATACYAGKLMLLLPVAIVCAVVALRSARGGQHDHATNEAVHAVLTDELRQASLQRAYRAAFFAMLLCQPVLAVALVWIPLAAAPAIMATVTVAMGACVFLGAFLWLDRA